MDERTIKKIFEIDLILKSIFKEHRFIKFICSRNNYVYNTVLFKFERINEFVNIGITGEQIDKTSISQIIWLIINKLENSDIY